LNIVVKIVRTARRKGWLWLQTRDGVTSDGLGWAARKGIRTLNSTVPCPDLPCPPFPYPASPTSNLRKPLIR